jgi:uncharacterized protein (DUF2235 family)
MSAAPKNIVLLSDGTGNSSAKLLKTNVWRVYEALRLDDPTVQVACYDDGVGTSTFKPLALLGGAVGVGLRRNVLRLYRFLCEHYEPGDRIYAFGFSRGAFTIRLLVGLICDQGIIKTRPPVVGKPAIGTPETGFTVYGSELARLSRWAYREFRKKFKQTGGLVTPARWFRDNLLRFWEAPFRPKRSREIRYRKDLNHKVTSIEFVGVWDTVDAYGLPVDELTDGIDKWVWPLSMPECRLSPKVQKACHALALDDERNTFHPVLWDESQGNTTTARDLLATGQVPDAAVASQEASQIDDEWISQVWFAGMHSNVGGGYPDDALSCVSLTWMTEEAKKHGLHFYPQSLAQLKAKADPLGRIYDARSGLKAYYRYNPRKIEVLTHDPKITIHRPKIHQSVVDRLKAAPEAYAPFTIPENYAVAGHDGTIVAPSFEQLPRIRADLQEQAWDLVWWKRVVYFATVAVTLWLILLPFKERVGTAPPVEQNLFARLILSLGQFLPSPADRWVNYYAAEPLPLGLGLVALIALTVLSRQLQASLCGRMRRAWLDTTTVGPGVEAPRVPSPGLVYKLRRSDFYQGMLALFRRTIYPNLFGIGALVCMVAAGNRLVFEGASAAGAVCPNSGRAVTLGTNEGHTATLASASFCTPTTVRLEAGASYRFDLAQDTSDPWRDRDVDAPFPAGFSGLYGELPWWKNLMFLAATPFRRQWMQPWYVPMARVGPDPFEQYALSDTVNTITPRTSGRLFLFVNDAILPASLTPPGLGWAAYYRNNLGTAKVTVTKIAERGEVAAVP